MYIDNLTAVDKVLVRKEVFETTFVCDLKKCKGACCTLESSYGAPLQKEEIQVIEKYLPVILENVPEAHKEIIEQEGFWEEKEGELFTKSVNDKECVFVYYENNIAKCGIEKTYKEGKIDFLKPISCHLFPIRISKFGGDVLRYEKFSQCEPALENGKKLKVTIAEFCKDSLTRLYGSSWYEKLRDYFRR
jgi:hypothetical protein